MLAIKIKENIEKSLSLLRSFLYSETDIFIFFNNNKTNKYMLV